MIIMLLRFRGSVQGASKFLVFLMCDHSNEYLLVVLFVMLHKVVLSFQYVDEIPKCDYSNESN